MPRFVQFGGVIHEFPDAATDEMIADALRPSPKNVGVQAEEFAARVRASRRQGPTVNEALDMAEDWAPTVGAALGGMAGAPSLAGAVGTAALGGSAGVAARNLIRGLRGRTVPSQTRQVRDMATEGVTQGAMELAGGAVGLGLKAGAKRAYGGLLKPGKELRREFPTVVDDLIKDRRVISPGDWFGGGLRGAERDLAKAAQKGDAMIEAAAPNASRVTAGELLDEFKPVYDAVEDRIRVTGATPNELQKIKSRTRKILDLTGTSVRRPRGLVRAGEAGADDWYQQTGPGLDLIDAQRYKRVAQDSADAAYRQLRMGNKSKIGTNALLDVATARGLKKGLERRVPGLREANQATQRLIGQEAALSDAVGRTGNHLPFGSVSDVAAMMAGQWGPAAGAAAKASTMAGPGSWMAIQAYRAGKIPYAQLVRILRQQAQTQDAPAMAVSHDQD